MFFSKIQIYSACMHAFVVGQPACLRTCLPAYQLARGAILKSMGIPMAVKKNTHPLLDFVQFFESRGWGDPLPPPPVDSLGVGIAILGVGG